VAEPFNIKVTIKEVVKGECSQGFKAGDSWTIKDAKTPGGMCASAYNAMAPAIRTLRYGGEFPWSEDKDVSLISCPDLQHWVVYEVRRFR